MDRILELVKISFPSADVTKLNMLKVDSCEGWDSMAHFYFLISIEDAFGTRFEVEEISELKSVIEIVECLRKKGIEV